MPPHVSKFFSFAAPNPITQPRVEVSIPDMTLEELPYWVGLEEDTLIKGTGTNGASLLYVGAWT